jgi:ABC-type transport system substrate-binding protein
MKKKTLIQAIFTKWSRPVNMRKFYIGALCLAAVLIVGVAAVMAAAWLGNSSPDKETDPSATQVDDLLAHVPDAAIARKDLLIVGIDDPLETINPLFSTGDGEMSAADLIFEPLIRLDQDNQPTACLASSWEYDPATNSLVFILRQDHSFRDGRVVAADDVIFTYRCLLDNSYDGPLSDRLDEIISVEIGSLENSIQFTLADWVEEPDFRQFTAGILKFDYYQCDPGHVFDIRNKNLPPQGSGPYYLADQESQTAVLQRRPGYGGSIRQIQFQVVDSAAKYKMLLDGKLDIVRNVWDQRMEQRVKNLPGYTFVPIATSIDSFLLVNPQPLPGNVIQLPSQRLAVLFSAAGKTLSELQQSSLAGLSGKELIIYYFQGLEESVRLENQIKARQIAGDLQTAGLSVQIKATDWPDLVQRAISGEYDLLLLPATANSRLPEQTVILDSRDRPDASALIASYRPEVYIVSNRLAQLTISPLGHPFASIAVTWTDRIENIRIYNQDGTFVEP